MVREGNEGVRCWEGFGNQDKMSQSAILAGLYQMLYFIYTHFSNE